MSKKYVSVLKDSSATPGYRIIAPEDYVYTENGTKKVKKIDSKADKKVPASAGNLAALDSTGNLADSGKKTSDFMAALPTAYSSSGSATKTVTKVEQATTGEVSVTYSDIQTASTSQKGLVQLEDSTSSTSTSKAATPNAVKSAYDLANGKYSKPSGGIPSSDLDSSVQASLGKADSAIQGVTLNGTTLTPSSAKVVDLGNLKTAQAAVTDPTASGTTITAIATISQDTNGVITATKKTIRSASSEQSGVMSAADYTKLAGIATGAEVNQNAFSNVKVGDVIVAADSKTDTLTVVAGSNVAITPDATNDKITIAATDTTYTADDGIKLDGTVFKHTNSVSGGTVGPTTDTAGASFSIPYVTYDSQGHVTASGTRTHDVGTASTSGAGIVQLQDTIDSTATKAATPNAVKKAIEALDVGSVGGAGKYISAISETDGKISATATTMDSTPTASSTNAVTSGGVKSALDGKADKASGLTGATKCKITYNSDGIVTAGADLAYGDIPIGNKYDNVKAFETTLTPWLCYEITDMGLNADYKASTADIMVFQYGSSGRTDNLSYKISVHWTRREASVEVEGSDIRGTWTAVVVNSATPESTDVTTLKLYCTPSIYTTFRLHIISCKLRGSTATADGTITKKNVQEAIPEASELVIIGTTTVKTLLNANDVTSTYSATGTAPVNGTAVAEAIASSDFSHISQNKLWHSLTVGNTGSSQGWFKFATINKKNISYESYRIVGYLYYDEAGNFNSGALKRIPFQAIVNYTSDVYRLLIGKSTTGTRLRLAKISDTKYELQFYAYTNKSIGIHATHDKTNSATNDVVFETTLVAGSEAAGVVTVEEDLELGSFAYRSVGDKDGNDITTTYVKTADMKQDGVSGATVNRFGTCSTAAGTAAKTVTITSGTFSLEAGAQVAVKFSNTNTANSPTLAVNSTAAKNIFVNGSQITSGSNKGILAGTVLFIYDGTQYHVVGNYDSNDTAFAKQFSLGITGNAVNYTMFARTGIANATGHVEAQILFSSGGNYGYINMGTWLITISNRGSSAETPKASMTVRCLNKAQQDQPTFGYYYDTTNSYIYFGVKSPAYRGISSITVLANDEVTLQDFGDSTTAPTGWTAVTITEYSATTHTHGNIQSGGTLQTTDVTIANGDKLVVTDASDSNKVARASAAFDGSTTSKALTQKGTFESVMLQADAMGVSGGAGIDITYSGSTATFAANIPAIATSVIDALA